MKLQWGQIELRTVIVGLVILDTLFYNIARTNYNLAFACQVAVKQCGLALLYNIIGCYCAPCRLLVPLATVQN